MVDLRQQNMGISYFTVSLIEHASYIPFDQNDSQNATVKEAQTPPSIASIMYSVVFVSKT